MKKSEVEVPEIVARNCRTSFVLSVLPAPDSPLKHDFLIKSMKERCEAKREILREVKREKRERYKHRETERKREEKRETRREK